MGHCGRFSLTAALNSSSRVVFLFFIPTAGVVRGGLFILEIVNGKK